MVAPEQIGDTGLKVGVMSGFTVILMVVVVAHCPVVGVKVYTVVPGIVVLMDAFQVPVIDGTLVELKGNNGGIEFWHKGPMELNVGITFGVTVIRTVFEPVHPEVVLITL